MPAFKFYASVFVFLATTLLCSAQPRLQEVPGLPTHELNDLHVDKQGYLWIAHNLGISRYDGLNYVHFSHPAQASLSIWDITEDGEGRIWCHNSSGQIFYIESGQMKWLTGYQFEKETQFTHIAVCGDELVATSDNGLFVCSTKDLTYKYLPLKNHNRLKALSLAPISRKAVLWDGRDWFVYEKKSGIKALKCDTAINSSGTSAATLHPASYGNLLFLIANPLGILEKLWLKGDSLKLVSKSSLNDYINAVSISDQIWIHTRNSSSTIDGKWLIEGQSLTDAVQDKEGNTWFSSSKKGLLVNYGRQQWQVLNPLADQEDFIRSLNVSDGYFFAGTNRGNLMVFDSTLTKAIWEQRLFDGYGSIDFIRFYKEHLFVVGSSVNTFVVNPVEKKLEDLLPMAAVRDVDFDMHSLYMATSGGLYVLPYVDSAAINTWQVEKKLQFPYLTSGTGANYLFAGRRGHAIRFDPIDSTLYVALKNGLHQFNKRGIVPFMLGGKPVFATSLWYKDDRLFIGTTNDGLWIKKGAALRHFTSADVLQSNTILRIKAIGSHLWIFENESLQVLDIEKESLLQNIALPKLKGANVSDVTEWNGFAYLTTAEGIYKVPMVSRKEEKVPTGFLDAVIVNNKDTAVNGMVLPYFNNDLQFVFSAPAFYDPDAISFRYRLVGIDEEWKTTQPGERVLRYATLPPGQYRFEAFAMDRSGLMQKNKILFGLTIDKPWWQEWWFYALIFLLVIALIYSLYVYRIGQLKKVEKVRRSISSDLHDDIGATLSSINIYTELAKKDGDNKSYLAAIQQHATEVISKLDDLIWSINPKNDSFAQLANRMRVHATGLLQAKGISFSLYYNDDLSGHKVSVDQKQHLYLIFKELINNVVKHSGASHCTARLDYINDQLLFSVADDGIGFTHNKKSYRGNGIPNMQERAKALKGFLKTETANGQGTVVQIQFRIGGRDWNIKKWYTKWINK